MDPTSRWLEALSLRVKDVDFDRGTLPVRGGKGHKDRDTVFPTALHEPLRAHLVRVKRLHDPDLAGGAGSVSLPGVRYRNCWDLFDVSAMNDLYARAGAWTG